MTNTVRVYRSTDASAPVLTGQVGKLTDLLDAILVNGYGSQTAAGWTINQTTTNKRGYLQNTTGSNNASGMLLYVDDTGPGAGAAKEARCCGFATMSAITPTGTGQFPTGAQSAIGTGQLVIRKSTTADATARAWTCVADGHTVYLFIETGDQIASTTNGLAAYPFAFGDFFSYKPTADTNAVMIMARTAENVGNAINDGFSALGPPNLNLSALTLYSPGCFVAGNYTNLGTSIAIGKNIDGGQMLSVTQNTAQQGGQVTSGIVTGAAATYAIGRTTNTTYFPYPNPPDGACWLSPIRINHPNMMRGYFKGLWAPLHDRPLTHNDTYTISSGNMNGKSMVVQAITANINNVADAGQIHVETSNTWT